MGQTSSEPQPQPQPQPQTQPVISQYEAKRLREENSALSSQIRSLISERASTELSSKIKDASILQLKQEIDKLKQDNLKLKKVYMKLKQENTEQRNLLIPQTREEFLLQELLGENCSYALKLKLKLAEVARDIEKNTKSTQTNDHDLMVEDDGDLTYNAPAAWIPNFPNISPITYRWFKIVIERFPGAEPPGMPLTKAIDVVNLEAGLMCTEDILKDKIKPAQTMGDTIFYHATNTDGAKSILKYGIDVTKSWRNTDFSRGRGFYVTDNFKRTLYWSQRVADWRGSSGAIIIFRTNTNLLDERHLALNVDNDTNRKWWECIVSHFRHGETSPDVTSVLRDVNYIKGPVAINRSLEPHEIPTPYDFSQLCIRNQDFARRFGSLTNICCVIFFN